MPPSKYSFLKQWFTFTWDMDNTTDLVWSGTNNHYLHTWLETHGYDLFENVISKDDLDDLVQAINESVNEIPPIFEEHFPDEYVENYSLWNMETGHSWRSLDEYREYTKEQMEKMLEQLVYFQDSLDDGYEGVLKYNIYYNH
jgi:hypothetical protein